MLFDAAVVESVVEATPLWAAYLLLVVSYLGSIYVIAPAVCLVYWRTRGWETATWLGTILAAYALFVASKPLTDVDRPDVESPLADQSLAPGVDQLHEFAVAFDTASFPSGHAIAVTVFWGLIVADLDVGSVRQRIGAGIGMVAAVGLSRVVLGTHYVGDIVGGVIMGLALLGVVFVIRARFSRPVAVTLAIAAVLATVGILVGRPVDGMVLLAATGLAFVVDSRLDIRGGRLPFTQPVKTG